ncbi:hypothetical protein Tco_1376901 [Tanacetum coccineum]
MKRHGAFSNLRTKVGVVLPISPLGSQETRCKEGSIKVVVIRILAGKIIRSHVEWREKLAWLSSGLRRHVCLSPSMMTFSIYVILRSVEADYGIVVVRMALWIHDGRGCDIDIDYKRS